MAEIVNIIEANPVTVLIDETRYSEFYKAMKAVVSAHVPDVSTDKGRKEIAALAFKVTRTKTAIDAAGKKLNEDARTKINLVDASRRKIREELDALAEEARKPLTLWEEAEEDRQNAIEEWHAKLRAMAMIASGEDGSDLIADRIATIEAMSIDDSVFRIASDAAREAKTQALAALNIALDRARKHEADQAELARLREEAEARAAVEAERIRIETEARERAEREARENAAYAEAVKRQAEEAERSQKEAAEREARAVEAARQEAIRKAQAEHAAELAKVEAERKRLELAEESRLAEIARAEREEAARAADRKHRGEVMSAAKTAIMALGVEEGTAKKIVLAIVAGEIPNVTLRF
jgi:colicin import membrane protein